MARRGRPKGVDSAETRRRIVDAARREFALSGFDRASLANIAATADLAPSAVYHYFGGKAELYEAVFDETFASIWTEIENAATQPDSLLANIEAIVSRSTKMRGTLPHYSDFLVLLPTEVLLHPEFGHLLDRRSKRHDETFGAMAELGVATGELDGFDVPGATEMLRALVMGWFFESHLHGGVLPGGGEAIVTVIRLLGERRAR